MGYEIHFAPSEKKMEEYKPWGYDKPNYESGEKRVKETRLELLTYCLKDHKEDGCYRIHKQLRLYLNLLKSEVEAQEKEFAYKRWLENEEHELWYCGWEFSHDLRYELDDVIEHVLEELVILTDVVETPNYFEDNEKFDRKRATLIEKIDEFIDSMSEVAIHSIITDLDEFKKNYDDDEFRKIEGIDETKPEIAIAMQKIQQINPVKEIIDRVKEVENGQNN